MSHAVRGPGRGGKPNQEQHVAPIDQKFVTPLVGMSQGYRGGPPPQVSLPPQQGYHPQYSQYGQQHNYYQPPMQQQQYNYRQDYSQQGMYGMYQQQQPVYSDQTVNYAPQHNQQPQQPAQPAEPKPRKVLQIVDPSTNEAIDFSSAAVAPAAAAPPAPVAPEIAEKKQLLSREFMVAVKKEISEDQKTKAPTTSAASVVPPVASAAAAPVPHGVPNFSVPPPSFGHTPPGGIPTFVPAVVPQVASVPPPGVIPSVPAEVQNQSEKNDTVVPETEEPTTPPAGLEAQAKSSPAEVTTTGASEVDATSPSSIPPALSKADSKEEAEDDKFDENTSQCDETSTPEPGSGEPEKTPEELAAEKAQKEAEAAERKRQQEEQLDNRIAELLAKGDGDVTNGTYARDFMVAVREYEKVLSRTPCPLSPEKLSDFGLDLKSMKVLDKKPNFTPTWVPNSKNNRQHTHPYRGRTTTDGTGRGAQPRDRQNHKRPPVVRPSIERVQRVTLTSSKDAWKPDRQKKTDNSSEEEKNVKNVCKLVRSLMNKITPTSQGPLTEEFIKFDVSSNESQLSQVVEIVFDKAVEEPKFCALYAELCKSQVDHELSNTNPAKSLFRNRILTRTQQTFQDKKEYDDERWAVIAKEEDPEKRALLEIEEKQKFRRRKFGVMTFIGYLYRNHLLSTKIVHACVYELLSSSILPKKEGERELPLRNEDIDEESVHCALQLIETVGAMLDKDKTKDQTPGTLFLDQWLQKLETAKPFCTNKIRFMVMNLIELRGNKWVPRKSTETGPKKIDEIHKDIRQEKLDNEKARDQYDRDRDRDRRGVRPNSNSMRKNAPANRNSLERGKGFQPPEQRRAAAAAHTKLASSSVQPKNISLSATMNDSTLGKSKKEWQTGASGGGITSSEAPKSVWGRRDSDQRKKSMVDDKQAALSAAKEIGNLSMNARRSTSQNSIADLAEEELTEEQKAKREKLINTIHSDIKEVVAGDLPMKEMVDAIKDHVGKELYAQPSLAAVYEMAFRSIVERAYKADQRRSIGHILRLTLVGKSEKKAFIDGAVNFCKYAIEVEMWYDVPTLWTLMADVLANTSHVPHGVIMEEKVEHLALSEMEPIFRAAKAEGAPKKYDLFVQFIRGLVESELAESGASEGIAWDYSELSFKEEMERDGLKDELEKVVLSNGKTLAQSLKN